MLIINKLQFGVQNMFFLHQLIICYLQTYKIKLSDNQDITQRSGCSAFEKMERFARISCRVYLVSASDVTENEHQSSQTRQSCPQTISYPCCYLYSSIIKTKRIPFANNLHVISRPELPQVKII